MAIWEEIMCKRCRQKVHVSNVKCDIDGELICIPCLDKLKTKKLEKKSPLKSKLRDNFQCFRCRYRFSIGKTSRVVLKCPYRNSEKVEKVIKTSANDLLKKSADNLYEF